MPEVRLLPRTTVFGYYDHNYLSHASSAVTDHLPARRGDQARASACGRSGPKQVVLATGAIERPLVFADNDRPGRDAGRRRAHLR